MTARKATKNSKTSPRSTALVAGAVGLAVAAGAGGYATGVFTTQDIQDFEPVYAV